MVSVNATCSLSFVGRLRSGILPAVYTSCSIILAFTLSAVLSFYKGYGGGGESYSRSPEVCNNQMNHLNHGVRRDLLTPCLNEPSRTVLVVSIC